MLSSQLSEEEEFEDDCFPPFGDRPSYSFAEALEHPGRVIPEAGSRREAQPPLQSSSLPFWAAPLGVFRLWPLSLTGIRPSGRTGRLALYAIV